MEDESQLAELEDGPTDTSDPLELLPQTYRVNSPEETQLLAIADSFQRQYLLLCPDRKPLLLCPVNECGVRKFVCTFLHPTTTQHLELHTWQGCATFVADFLSLKLLDPPTEVPSQLFSCTSVLRSQKACCFEYAILLCSLLLGNNYDAYCVSGYAVKELCHLDQSLQECPLLDTEDKSIQKQTPEENPQEKKYTVRRPKEPKINFLLQQEKREDETALIPNEEELELQRRSADPLRGLRVHCWVLVLSGSRSIQENFFIDPLTGSSYRTDSKNFLGIESLWNDLNYFVNMQDCSHGCTDVSDLEDLRLWEPILYGAISRKQLKLQVKKREETSSGQMSSEEKDQHPNVFEMPRSWVVRFSISEKDLEMRYPGMKKVCHYRKGKLEKFLPSACKEGITMRLTTYRDVDCTEVAAVKEWFKNRHDCLEKREINHLENSTSEFFRSGSSHHVSGVRWQSLPSGETRELLFSHARADRLARRVLLPGEMKEFFDGRLDFLYYRHVVFDLNAEQSSLDRLLSGPEKLMLLKVVERFHRNKYRQANEDVAQRVFLVPQKKIDLTFHLMDHRFIPSKRTFIKPSRGEQLTQNQLSIFEMDQSTTPIRKSSLERMLQELLAEEKETAVKIKHSVEETKTILACREMEEKKLDLSGSQPPSDEA